MNQSRWERAKGESGRQPRVLPDSSWMKFSFFFLKRGSQAFLIALLVVEVQGKAPDSALEIPLYCLSIFQNTFSTIRLRARSVQEF
jgi:hypothetical protein